MQYIRRFSLCWVLLCCITGNSYAASRDSRATLHISVTLVSTIATGTTEPVEQTQLASSEDRGIIYNLCPNAEQTVAEAAIASSQSSAREPVRTNLNDSSNDEPIVEVTTVVMK